MFRTGKKPLLLFLSFFFISNIAISGVSATPNIPGSIVPEAGDNASAQSQAVLDAYSRLPLYFEANQGQTDASVRYLAHGNGYTLFLTENQAVISMVLGQPSLVPDGEPQQPVGKYNQFLTFEGANPHPTISGESQQPGVSSYFVGSAQDWHTNIAHYGQVRYQNLYDGIDAVFYGNPEQLQYDLVVAPFADPAQIQLDLNPAENLSLMPNGDLVVPVGTQHLTMKAPYSYQVVDGVKVPVESHFDLSDGQLSFALGAYDPGLPLVIDPVLKYAGYIGGNSIDYAYGIAVDFER